MIRVWEGQETAPLLLDCVPASCEGRAEMRGGGEDEGHLQLLEVVPKLRLGSVLLWAFSFNNYLS